MSRVVDHDGSPPEPEALHRLVAGVAHDLNNLLTSITALSALTLRDLGADHPNRRDLVEIESAAQRAAALTRHLVDVARGSQPVPPQASAEDAERTVEGTETILLTEDDPSIRRLVARILERAGYQVLQAAGAAEAMTVAEGAGGRVDLLLTDVVMPGGSGEALYAGIHRKWPGVRVLYMSGYTDSAVVRREAGVPGGAYLPKPFAPEVLLATVRRVLDRESQTLADR